VGFHILPQLGAGRITLCRPDESRCFLFASKVISPGVGDGSKATWGLLFDAGGDARANGIPFDEERTSPWKEGWIETDVNLGVHGVETL